MKKTNIIFLFVIWAFNSFAIEIPLLTGRVNDYANLLSTATVNTLEQKLTQLEQRDSTQVVILTIPSLKGVPIENFAIAVFNGWGIGRAKIDNGVLLIIALEDRSIRIEVGRGLEGRLTDVTSARIIRDDIKPLLAQGDFNSGITQGINSIIKVIQGEYTQTNFPNKTNDGSWLVVVITLFFVSSKLFPFRASQKSRLIYATIGSATGMFMVYYWGKQNTLMDLSLTSGISFAVCYILTYIGRFIPLGGGRGNSGDSGGGSSFSGGGGRSGGGGASGKF
jgi:uncharacterized protein